MSRRAEHLAVQLDAQKLVVNTSSGQVLVSLAKYAAAAARTACWLVRVRPRVVLVTAPPIPACVVVLLLSRPLRYNFILDSHPGAFGLMNDRLSRILQPLHTLCLRHAAYVVVATPELVTEVVRRGGSAGILHEPPAPEQQTSECENQYILYAASGGRDEPHDVVIEAAREMPESTFLVTGDVPHAQAELPSNISYLGWVSPSRYERLLNSAMVVVVLSTEEQSVMRSAYEASFAMRPLVVSKTAATKRYFPASRLVENTSLQVVAGIKDARVLDRVALLKQRDLSVRYWNEQFSALQSRLQLCTRDVKQ